ncbi:MAG: 1-acyl-sn-glycerol-3-phosphate acyltransferase [Ginsengibacter sp.]
MLYKILLLPARLFLHFYCKKIVINDKSMLYMRGPLIIAANHPNSFLDAIIMATLFRHPVHSLARGDAFAGKKITKILTTLNMLPVYRISEGAENLEHNYSTFEACQNLFKKGEIVLIFSEGQCINEWHLRPLKKGTARLALTAWQQNIPLSILPLGINYSSFRKFGKILHLNFGNIITKKDIRADLSSSVAVIEFNKHLQQQLKNLVFEIDKNDHEKLQKYFYFDQSFLKKSLLFLPAMLGYIFHFPLYYTIHFIIKDKAVDHYDSIMTGLLFFIYPLYVLALTMLIFFVTGYIISLLLILLLPATALCLLHFKRT